jgi:hypothetical protein
MTFKSDIFKPYEIKGTEIEIKKPSYLEEFERVRREIHLDDTTGELTPKGKQHLKHMVYLLIDPRDLVVFHGWIEPVAQKYIRRRAFIDSIGLHYERKL